MCLFIELGRHVNHGERMNSIGFGGYRSKVKVTMGITDKCGVRGDATLCVLIFDFVLMGHGHSPVVDEPGFCSRWL